MPTRNPRVNVVVTEEQHELLAELGRRQSRSSASLVRDMLDAATPVMRRTVELLRFAEETHGQTREAAREALAGLVDELQALAGVDGAQLDLMALLGAPAGSGELASAEPEADAAPSGARAEAASRPARKPRKPRA